MELRHLRYFVAVAEAGSMTVAAEQRLHTSQPSLSRQLRDLEQTVGAKLLERSVHGVTLTQAGAAFLEHARLALAQVDAAVHAARRTLTPAKPALAMGFLTGQEMEWLPAAMHVLRDELPNIDVTVSSQYSPQLAEALMHGRLDLAFMRREANTPDLLYTTVMSEPLMVVLPSNHALAGQESIAVEQLAAERFVGMSKTAPALQAAVEAYLQKSDVDLRSTHEIDNLSMAMSLVSSLHAVTLLPRYAGNFLTRSVVSRPLRGEVPTIDLVVGHHRANNAPGLKLFLSRLNTLTDRAKEIVSSAQDC